MDALLSFLVTDFRVFGIALQVDASVCGVLYSVGALLTVTKVKPSVRTSATVYDFRGRDAERLTTQPPP
jgi:hypothetical protein